MFEQVIKHLIRKGFNKEARDLIKLAQWDDEDDDTEERAEELLSEWILDYIEPVLESLRLPEIKDFLEELDFEWEEWSEPYTGDDGGGDTAALALIKDRALEQAREACGKEALERLVEEPEDNRSDEEKAKDVEEMIEKIKDALAGPQVEKDNGADWWKENEDKSSNPKSEVDPTAPSVEDLNQMFKFEQIIKHLIRRGFNKEARDLIKLAQLYDAPTPSSEGQVIIMSHLNPFTLEAMGGLEKLLASLDVNEYGVEFSLHKITEPRKNTGFRSRIALDYTSPEPMSQARIKSILSGQIKRFNLMREFEPGEIKTEERKKFFPKKRTTDQEKCQWCSRTDCHHMDR